MKHILLTAALCLAPSLAAAQCNGIFPPSTVCGNFTGTPAPPSAQAISTGGSVTGPGFSIVNDFALWDNTTGTLLKDAGYGTGAAGHTIPFLDGTNTWGATQTFAAINATSIGTTSPGIGTFTSVIINGATSGAITLAAQAAAGTWNFNFPIAAGTAGQSLLSGGGGGAPMTWGNPSAAPPAFTNLGSGAVATTVDAKLKTSPLSAKDYGAACDGSTDDSAAFQAMINQAITSGSAANFYGTCRIHTTLILTGAINLGGNGKNESSLLMDAGVSGIAIDTVNGVFIHDFSINWAPGSSASGIFIALTSGENQFSTFSGLQFYNSLFAINFSRASFYTIVDNTILNVPAGGVGMILDNQDVCDAGDMTVSGNLISTFSASQAGIIYRGGGGLRVINNKILGSGGGLWTSGISEQLPVGCSTSDLLITGNSIEGIDTYGIILQRSGTTGGFSNVIITGNEFAEGPNYCVYVPTDPSGFWLNAMTVTGNTCFLKNASGAVGFWISGVTGLALTANVVATGGTTQYVQYLTTIAGCSTGGFGVLGTFIASVVSGCSTYGLF